MKTKTSILIALASSAMLTIPAAGAVTAEASLDYSCANGGNPCWFAANGSHGGLGIVKGTLTVSGSGVGNEEFQSVCTGIPRCSTSISGDAAYGCITAFAETTDTTAPFEASHTVFKCQQKPPDETEELASRLSAPGLLSGPTLTR